MKMMNVDRPIHPKQRLIHLLPKLKEAGMSVSDPSP